MNEFDFSKSSTGYQHQVLRKALDILCGKWRLQIIFQLREQDRRYGELRRLIPAISEKVLIQELNALVAAGVLRKTSFKEMPPRVEYGLTEKANTIIPVLEKLFVVGQTFSEAE